MEGPGNSTNLKKLQEILPALDRRGTSASPAFPAASAHSWHRQEVEGSGGVWRMLFLWLFLQLLLAGFCDFPGRTAGRLWISTREGWECRLKCRQAKVLGSLNFPVTLLPHSVMVCWLMECEKLSRCSRWLEFLFPMPGTSTATEPVRTWLGFPAQKSPWHS